MHTGTGPYGRRATSLVRKTAREFVARVGALTRRGGAYTPSLLTVGNTTLNRSTFELVGESASVRLSSKEFQMLELLMRQKRSEEHTSELQSLSASRMPSSA